MIPKFQASSYAHTGYVDARNYVGGEWVDGSGSEVLPVINPRHGQPMASVRMSTTADVDAAVKAATAAVQDWKLWPMRERAHVMYRAREIMMRDIDELSWLVSHENGKIFAEAKAEVEKGIECVEYGCSLPNIAAGGQLEVSRGVRCEVVHAPLGVVAGIVPFNFPFMVPLWMMPQALVGGNAFLLKPSEQVPLSSLRLAQIFADAGLPKGILSLVQGGRETVEALCDHPGIEAVAFVGSTKVAKLVYARAAAAGKRALCLGGAKNHLIVVPDADPDLTADNVVASYAGCAGQRCMAASVLVAVGDVQHIIDRVVAKSAAIKLGEELGPITNAGSVQRITGYIDQAEQAGAKVLVDGRGKKPAEAAAAEGYWVGPTLIDQVTGEMPAAREEIFGPVLSIVRVGTLEEAIALENANPYGNASSVYTTSGDVAQRVMNEVEAGMCGVNIGVPVPREPFGFGGWNDSLFGHGNITGWDGFLFWTRQRKITSKWSLQKDQTWMS
jgi:malonate-semialdehyde dehydrogenase (acetylating) / methylmalonate-semialdehyde dehydrogenase